MANRFSKKAQDSILGKLVSENVLGQNTALNALDFIESPNGLNVQLYPVQRVIVRCLFSIPFTYRPIAEIGGDYDCVPVYDKFREKLLYKFTEAEYLQYIHDQGRSNVGRWEDLKPGGYREAAIFAGRRAGKSQVVSAIGAYYLYRLLHIRSPQEYYGLREGSPIDFTFMAQDDMGSGRLFDKLREDINQAPFFKKYLKPGSNSELNFITEADRHKANITPSITVASFACTTNAVRGPSSVFLALDEFAHFRSDKNASSDAIYEAATPATMQFVPKEGPNAGKREAMVLCISSPWKRVGKMFELHSLALKEGKDSNIFTMNVGTAEMNPRADSEFLIDKSKTAALTWKAEYGGQFLDSSESYVSSDHVEKCLLRGHENIITFSTNNLGKNYFWGLDLGMANDATALAIGHLEVTDKGIELIYDYIDRMMVGERFTGPGVPTGDGVNRYVNHKELNIDEIGKWLLHMHNILPCYKGYTDQHGGRLLVQLLHMLGIPTVELQNLSAGINSQMYIALKSYIDQGLCQFPKSEKFVHELKTVEATFTNKYQIRVAAPEEKGQHDDMADAAALVAFLAQNWLEDEGRLKLDPSGQSIIRQQQMAKPAAPLLYVDSVNLRDLKIQERLGKSQRNVGFSGGMAVVNPFHRRGGR
jgi:hypothetical protein